jgi:threonine dehydratase
MSGFTCATCAEKVSVDTFAPWRCPNEKGDRHHVLLIDGNDQHVVESHHNPFIAFRRNMMWWQFAQARGMSDERAMALVHSVDEEIAKIGGVGFTRTPMSFQSALSDHLSFESPGGVWVKDETHNVGGSQKARHLMSILLHLLVAEELGIAPWANTASRPTLAISSCGNAAIAASTLAAAAKWPIDVFIPEWAGGVVVETLTALGARINRCARQSQDPPGDPTVLRFREAVNTGSIPFSVQGPENALCLDGGRTIGWEMAQQFAQENIASLDAVFVQVGGGAFAASVSRGLSEAGIKAPLVAVQTEGCAPLSRAWNTAQSDVNPAQHWTKHMWAWENEPVSLADGILDDETYDWVADIAQIQRTGGKVVVASELQVVEASSVAPQTTMIDASPTGTAGVAGLLSIRAELSNTARVAVVLSGVRR